MLLICGIWRDGFCLSASSLLGLDYVSVPKCCAKLILIISCGRVIQCCCRYHDNEILKMSTDDCCTVDCVRPCCFNFSTILVPILTMFVAFDYSWIWMQLGEKADQNESAKSGMQKVYSPLRSTTQPDTCGFHMWCWFAV